jgi:hypothetical protein
MELLNIQVPDEWVVKYKKAVNIYKNLLRPDGTLPMYGDTEGEKRKSIYLSTVDDIPYYRYLDPLSIVHMRDSFTLLPRSGYSLWWDDDNDTCQQPSTSQTFIAWPNFISHAHKHADETSLLFWSNGQPWWTNIGYWPYGIKNRNEAVSWPGSNAVHYINEPTDSDRTTKLKSYYDGCEIKYLELVREDNNGYRVDRQVLKYKNVWLVLDSVLDGKKRPSRSAWTIFPDVSVVERGSHGYLLKRPDYDTGLSVVIAGSNAVNVKLHRGDMTPFSGWIVDDEKVVATNAFVLDLLPEAWSAVAWQPISEMQGQGLSSVDMMSWSSPQKWDLRITGSDHVFRIARVGPEKKLMIDDSNAQNSGRTVLLRQAQNSNDIALDKQFTALNNKYEHQKLYYTYRTRITWYLVVLYFLQEALFLVYINGRSVRAQMVTRYTSNAGWLVLAGWLYFFYFT